MTIFEIEGLSIILILNWIQICLNDRIPVVIVVHLKKEITSVNEQIANKSSVLKWV